jgi:hypothetical protein
MKSLVLGAWLAVASVGLPGQDPAAPNTDVRDVAVIAGRVERIDRFSRSVILRTTEGADYSVLVGRHLKIFDQLKPGDAVTVRTTESVAVVPKPHAKTTVVDDQTVAANKDGSNADVIQRLKQIVIIELVDQVAQTIAYKGADNRSVTRMVANRRLLEGLTRGDIARSRIPASARSS